MKPSEKRQKFILEFLQKHSDLPVGSDDLLKNLDQQAAKKGYSTASIHNELHRMSQEKDKLLGFSYQLDIHGHVIIRKSQTSTWLNAQAYSRY